ncbi:DUF2958 domain-containing protein [Shinella sedimenti]|uniref:DUF2958 domain-containing protein n=1 Tax=Shinella sedimenti TaxID=2919913 RepID=A0ABT0CSF0_9HYPH|nr:DUF2958 domain-containing protein [Shinella sedimenti]MCJ8151530.1 DUF2958 domain-containing protein [Shinella sedimenti]
MQDEQRQDGQHGSDHNSKRIEQARIDLALLFTTDLYVGSKRLHEMKRKGTTLNLQFDIDGDMRWRSYNSALSWRITMLLALTETRTVTIHEMDQPGRYRRMFPATLLRRLQWHAKPKADFPPVARFYDPHGKAVLLVTRSRFCGHAVDALHNLTEGGPVFQPLWISDIMALRPMLDIGLVRDDTFSASMPISTYLEAAGIHGQIVDEAELLSMSLNGSVAPLPVPPSSRSVAAIFQQECHHNPALAKLQGRSIYEDYALGAGGS